MECSLGRKRGWTERMSYVRDMRLCKSWQDSLCGLGNERRKG